MLPTKAGVLLCACLLGVAAGVPRLPRPAGPPRPQPRLFPAPRHRRLGIFPDNPLISVKRSFQDIQSNVERSMQSLLAAGSAIGQRMLGMITRAPRLLAGPPPVAPLGPGPAFQPSALATQGEGEAEAFAPYHAPTPDSYGAPAAGPLTAPADSYGSPLGPALDQAVYQQEDNSIEPDHQPHAETIQQADVDLAPGHHAEPDQAGNLVHEPVIHPGGSIQVPDYHKVEVLGAQSVVQAASAEVPDQHHPEKYLNSDSELLKGVVDHNLWYKETKKFKHHKHGQKHKVIPHLAGLEHAQ